MYFLLFVLNCQYKCKWLPRKAHLRNNLLCKTLLTQLTHWQTDKGYNKKTSNSLQNITWNSTASSVKPGSNENTTQHNFITHSKMLNVIYNKDYSVQNDESLHGKCTIEILDSEKRCDLRWQQKMESGAAVTSDGRLFHRRAAATGNALSPTVDRQVRRTSRDVDEAECSRHLGWVSSSQWYTGTKICWHLYTKEGVNKCHNSDYQSCSMQYALYKFHGFVLFSFTNFSNL